MCQVKYSRRSNISLFLAKVSWLPWDIILNSEDLEIFSFRSKERIVEIFHINGYQMSKANFVASAGVESWYGTKFDLNFSDFLKKT